jgi:gliding motility-associated-like protein
MLKSVRSIFLFLVTSALIPTVVNHDALAQCVGLPTVSSLGSNKFPAGFCSPVSARVTYNVGFLTPVPAGAVDIYIDWGDGKNSILPQAQGQTSYSADVTHTFPVDSDCEFVVVMTLRYKGSLCPITRQVQRIASWRTDEYNGGKVQLISPVTGTNEHQVCAGVDISVVFQDATNWNCNPNYIHPPGPDAVESPNIANRWQQIVYNTGTAVPKIPNLKVDGIPVTGAGGADILTNYQDTRGVNYMSSSAVIANNKRPSLEITAPGGFGAGYPQVGDVIELKVRYWNFCNPYSNNPLSPLVPVNGDFVNGDNPPVEKTATVRIVSAPPPPTPAADQTVCYNNTPNAFAISGVPPTYIVNWYKNVPGATDSPGALITSGTSTSLPITSHPDWVNKKTPGVYKVWASYQPNVANGLNCESPKVLVKRTIREDIMLPDPVSTIPTEVCNSTSTSTTTVTITMPPLTTEPVGGATQYAWTGSSGVTLASSTDVTATFKFNVNFSSGQRFVDRTIAVRKQYASSPSCFKEKSYTIRVYNPSVGGTLSSAPDVCQTSPVGNITLSGNIGDVLRWEVSVNGGAFTEDASLGKGTTISPGVLSPGVYKFRAVVDNGPCNEAVSSEEQVEVSTNPGLPANAGPDQFVCQLTGATLNSNPLAASDPSPGTGKWSYIGSVPSGLPEPTFSTDKTDRNAYISVPSANAGAYTLRWTVSSGSCSSYDDVVIDFGTDPTDPTAGADKQVCGPSTVLEGNTPSIGTGKWSVVSGPGSCSGAACSIKIDNTGAAKSPVNLQGSPYIYGAYTLRWTITSGGASCFEKTDDVVITFDEPAEITSAPDIDSVCLDPKNFTPIKVSGIVSAGATGGHWENISGNGTISASTQSGSGPITIEATYTPTQEDYDAGVPIRIKLVATPAATSSCSSVEEEVKINIDRKPVANAGIDIPNICESFVQLNADPATYNATGAWTTSVAGVTFDDKTNPQTTVRGLTAAPSSVLVTWTLTSASGRCVSDPSSITLTRAKLPDAKSFTTRICEEPPAGAPVTGNILLTNYEDSVTTLPAADRSITWYRNGTPPAGTQVTDPTIQETNITSGQIYLARIRDISSNCTNDAMVTVDVRALPVAKDATVAFCEDSPGSNKVSNIDLNDATYVNEVTGGANNVAVAWYPSLFDAQNNTFEITSAVEVNGSAKYYARITFKDKPSCADYAELTLTIKNIPASSEIFGRESVCQGDAVEIYQITPIKGVKYRWNIPTSSYKVFGGGTDSDFFVLLQFPTASVNGIADTISVQVELNGCSAPVTKKTILVSPTPGKPTIHGDSVVCENDEGISYNVTPNNYPASSYSWEVRKLSDNSQGGAFISDGQATNKILVNFLTEDVVISVQESNSICVSPLAKDTIRVNKRPIMLNGDADVCSDYATGVKFQADPSSPVPINKYNITNASFATEIIPIVGPTKGNGVADDAIVNDQFQNLKAVPLPVNYTVIPVNIGATGKECPGDAEIITLTIKPEPQLHPTLDKELCSDIETGIILSSASNTFPADKFIIESIYVPAGVKAISAIQTPDATTQYNSDAIKNHKWENNNGADSTVIYTIRPYSTQLNCAGAPRQVKVTVHPNTIIKPVTDFAACNNDLLHVPFESTNNTDATFTWTVKNADAYISTGSNSGQGDIDNLLVQNSKAIDGTVTFEVIGTNPATEGNCSGSAITFTVTVHPSPEATKIEKTVCSDVPGGNTYTADLKALESSITPNAGKADTRLTWYKSQTLNSADIIPDADLKKYTVENQIPLYVKVEYIPTGCTNVVTVEYTVNPSVSFEATPRSLLCNGLSNGEISIVVKNGTPTYSYKINNAIPVTAPSDNYTFTSLSGGNYTIVVEDLKGCRATSVVSLFEPTALVADVKLKKAISCFQAKDGEIETIVTGGTAPYTEYRIVQSNELDADNDGIFQNLGVGSYNVRVKDTNGCFATSEMLTMDQPTPVEINTVSVATDDDGYNLTCKDATDGEVKVTFTGGTPAASGYTAVLSKVNDATTSATLQGTDSVRFKDLGKGTYTIVIKDGNNCASRPSAATILNPPALNGGSIGVDQSVCLNTPAEKITELSPPFGGVENYRYQWQQQQPPDGEAPTTDNWIDIPASANGNSNEYTPEVLSQTTYFRRLVWSVSTRTGKYCEVKGTDEREMVKITVNQPPVVRLDAPSNLCYGKPGQIKLIVESGAIPITYSYTDGTNTVLNEEGGKTSVVVLPEITEDKTYKFYDIVDGNGCKGDDQEASISVVNVSTDFSIVGSDAQCPGNDFEFKWNVEPDVKYEWVWSRDSSTVIREDSLAAGEHTIRHGFAAGSPNNSTVYNVKLKASNFLCTPDPTTREITIYPLIALNVLPGDTSLCSGQTITFQDQSLGIDHGTWYYHVPGTTDRLEEKPAPAAEVSYVMTNTSSQEPIIYEVVYQAANAEGCTGEYKKEVVVYHSATADFTYDNVPPLTAGLSTITFTNTSSTINTNDFEYIWDFDDIKATPPTANGAGPYTVEYHAAGTKEVRLTVTNIAARNAGETCSSTKMEKITILLPAVKAAFTATPLAACFPANIEVTNLSPGADAFHWTLYNGSTLADSSSLRNPVFRVSKPGKYSIALKAEFRSTGQSDSTSIRGIEVFDVPTANFELRPSIVYIPDMETQTFNFSTGANQYSWNFDDGTISDETEPKHLYTLEGKYTITLVAGFDNGSKDVNGDGTLDGNIVCYDTAQHQVVAIQGGSLKVPNAFTPNVNGSTHGNGVPGSGTFNDVFMPIVKGAEEYTMQIYDRWGNMIYETVDKNQGWDGYDRNGKLMPAGVYVYKMVIRLSNGQRTTKVGDITLIR